MPLISVWKCPRTGTLFETKRRYLNHLKKMARESLDGKYRTRRIDAFYKSTAEFRLRACTEEDIIQWFHDNWLEVTWMCWHRERLSRYKGQEFDPSKTAKLLEVKFNLSPTPDMSDSWQKRAAGHEPKPGFVGRVNFTLNDIKGGYSYGSDLLDVTRCIYPGGGNGGKNSQYTVSLSSADWPYLQKGWDRARGFEKLVDPSYNVPRFM